MRAWQLDRLGGALAQVERPIPHARPGSVVVRMQSSALMSYMREYVDGKLAVYHVPPQPFIPGGNGVGIVEEVGRDVWHIRRGQRVVISSHFVAQENVPCPAQMLIGVTAGGEVAFRMQSDWPDGTLADYALLPASTVTPADTVEELSASTLTTTMRYIVPYGGLLRGRLAVGETVIVSGATGAYGYAAVRLAIAMGARRVVAFGRNASSLAELAQNIGPRVVPMAASGDIKSDIAALRDVTVGGAHLAFDMVGNAADPNATLAALRALKVGGRIVLMGSMAVPLPVPYTEVMLNGWEILGQFMYPRTAYASLLEMIGAGILSADAIDPVVFPFSAVPDAIDAAASASSRQCIVIDHEV
jgi:alcohol dehydrogenase